MIKIETRNPIEGYFGSEFAAICNQWSCGGLKLKDGKKFRFFAFLEKRSLMVKFSKILFRKFSSR